MELFSQKEYCVESISSRHVLKESEMALSFDGVYLGEVDNPSYGLQEKMFVYDPQHGLEIRGHRRTAEMTKDDLIAIPHHLGYITVERFLGEKKQTFSDNDFLGKLSQQYINILNKYSKITAIAKIFKIDVSEFDKEQAMQEASQSHSQYSPEEVMQIFIKHLGEKYVELYEDDHSNEFFEATNTLKNIDVLDVDIEKNKKAIVSYFYVWCKFSHIDASDAQVIFDTAFKNFPFVDELMAEFKRHADIRFGDALLSACLMLQSEWDDQSRH